MIKSNNQFPRVVLQLDEDSLQLSDECTEALKYITDKASIEAFKSKYGMTPPYRSLKCIP